MGTLLHDVGCIGDGDDMSRRLSQALASVKLYTDLDLCLVPRQPSQSQCLAGAEAGRVSPEFARIIYLAMVGSNEFSDAGP
jgi:hypothetical protein